VRRLRAQWAWRWDALLRRRKPSDGVLSVAALGTEAAILDSPRQAAEEQHTGLAAMAMPTLSSADSRGLFGRMLVLLTVVVVSFFVAILGISQIQNLRNQQVAFEDFRYELANATAPVYAADLNNKLLQTGTPVALLAIPSIGVNAVVVEGTTSDVTMWGPGHRRDTVIPGQEGVSVIYGRQFTYGATFNQISHLKKGDEITVTTGQGESKFAVDGIRYSDDPLPDAPQPGEGRLVLVSAYGSVPLIPDGIVRVDATLSGDANPTPLSEFSYAALGDEEQAMMGEARAWPYLALSLVVLVALALVFTLLRRFWGRWQTWIVAVPVFVATGIFATTQIATLFPNII